MGNCRSVDEKSQSQGKSREDYGRFDKFDVLSSQADLERTLRIPLHLQVAHFTPSSFPLMPVVNPKMTKLCEASWNIIVGNSLADEYGGSISGMTAFYSDFYDRLDSVDSNGRFDAVLGNNATGAGRIAAKGAIIIRIINFALKIEANNKQTQMLLYMLGKSHSQKQIRPWQYSVFIQTLLMTISSRLGSQATNSTMEAWVNLFAFLIQSMLPPAIKDQVVETELNINTSSDFAQGRIADEVAEISEVTEMKKKMSRAGKSAGGGSSISDSHSEHATPAGAHHHKSFVSPRVKVAVTSAPATNNRWPVAGGGGGGAQQRFLDEQDNSDARSIRSDQTKVEPYRNNV